MSIKHLKTCNSYLGAESLLAGKQECKLGNNTWAVRRSADCIAIRLHHTDVVSFYADGRIRLSSGGYRSNTTKQRINAFLPAPWRIYQKNWDWYLWNYKTDASVDFYSGIELTDTGIAGQLVRSA